jgi:hypothetical protein
MTQRADGPIGRRRVERTISIPLDGDEPQVGALAGIVDLFGPAERTNHFSDCRFDQGW